MLQQAVGTVVDGVLGPNTLQAAAVDPERSLQRLRGFRLRYYTGLPKAWRENFLAGVVNRVADNMIEG